MSFLIHTSSYLPQIGNHTMKPEEFEHYFGKIKHMTLEQVDEYLEKQKAEWHLIHPRARSDKAITGNPYYKLDREKIFCLDCGQRLGAMAFPCPICMHHTTYVYESMLKNPADPRWMEQPYQRKVMSSKWQIAQDQLKERMQTINNKDELK